MQVYVFVPAPLTTRPSASAALSSANASPEFEGRGGEALAGSIASCLSRAYGTPSALDLRPLCIVPAQRCWILYVDILVRPRKSLPAALLRQ